MQIFHDINFDFLGKKWLFIGLSAVLIAAGLISTALKGGIKYGIDFTGGAIVYVKFAGPPPEAQIRSVLSEKISGAITVQRVTDGNNEVIIGTELKDEKALEQSRNAMVKTLEGAFGKAPREGMLDFNNASQESLANKLRDPLTTAGVTLAEPEYLALIGRLMSFRNTPPQSGLIDSFDKLAGVEGATPAVLNVLKQECYLAGFTVRGVQMVGPKVANDLRGQAITATLLALAGMLVYIAFRFEWIYGVGAVLAVFHDTIITIGLFSIFDKEIDLTVVAALLTLVGYSMNDTIVIFDRVRENLKMSRREPLEALMNRSINQTMSRTVLASGLTFLTVLALYLFGGPVLNPFSFALVVGIIVGTYSSVFIASPIVLFWNNYLAGRGKGGSVGPSSRPAVASKTAVKSR